MAGESLGAPAAGREVVQAGLGGDFPVMVWRIEWPHMHMYAGGQARVRQLKRSWIEGLCNHDKMPYDECMAGTEALREPGIQTH